MKLKKRKKRSRLRGQKTCGYGFRKKHKTGKGNKGGKGMAGTGKRAGQKRTWINKHMPDYFGSHGFKSIKQVQRKKLKITNISEIEEKLPKLLGSGMAKKTPAGIELNLEGYKVLGNLHGELKNRFIIKASQASSGAKAKIEKSGGRIELIK